MKADEAVKLAKAFKSSGLDVQEAINVIHWASMGHENSVEVAFSDRTFVTVQTPGPHLTTGVFPKPDEGE